MVRAFIARKLIKEVLPLIRVSIGLGPTYDVITIILLIYAILPELN